MAINLEFEWYRKFSRNGSPAYECRRGRIHEVGSVREETRPLEDRLLFERFSQLDGSPAACVDFARWFGFLTQQEAATDRSEPLSLWRSEIKSVKVWIDRLKDKTVNRGRSHSSLGITTDVFLKFDAPADPSLVLRPRSLIDAMRLQMAQFYSSGSKLSSCVECGKSFEIGTARRADAKFCSDVCRFRHHNKRRAAK